MSDIEQKIVKHIFFNGRTVSYSQFLENEELRTSEFIAGETLSIEFFLKRRDWFKVTEIPSNESDGTDYIIMLINLQAKFIH